MRKERAQEFAARVAQGSRTDLIVIMYDVILEDIEEAKKIHAEMKKTDDGKPDVNFSDPVRENYRRELLHAARFASGLMAALDFSYQISHELRSLYVYAHKCLTAAAFSGDITMLADVEGIMNGLKLAFAEIAKKDESGPMMENVQAIAAGLTYGKDRLDEVIIDPYNINRGFFA